MTDGFAELSTEQLREVHGNLLRGLDRVAAHVDAGTTHQAGPKGETPPAQTGLLTLWLLHGVEAELTRRNEVAKTTGGQRQFRLAPCVGLACSE